VQPGQAEGEGVLGDERGVRTLAARPRPAVGHEPGVEKALDPGSGQMHPPDGRELVEDRPEATGPRPVHPHEAFGLFHRHHPTARADHGLGGERPVGDDGDARLGSTHERRS
jgi:hypothetical protein